MGTESSATTVWEGSLTKGRGTTNAASGALPAAEVTWAARVERTEGTTSPEELLAAAHASCYCMALSNGLTEAGNEPQRLEATATVTFVAGEGVRSSHLVVAGTVPGLDQAGFEAAAAEAAENCPISAALSGNVEITVDATLAE
ncbi:MAG: lipoyl-dependent peroxiredoxin [Solirubrobacterales bacterium]|nr:lipoyl-dependent peroxiredoxin [Solirubrobacterales bacterium]